VLLLREVQLLRFVDTEFLPFLAQIATEACVPKGELVCEQGQPTNGTLIIVAHGTLQLRRAGGYSFAALGGGAASEAAAPASANVLRELHAGDTLGTTTALLSDSSWQYTAWAADDTWTLTIDARDLSDVLRGRAELAHAVLRGFYYTFARRLRQILEQGGSVKREWMLAADVDKSPAPKGRKMPATFLR